MKRKAVVLLSGGLDSATVLSLVKYRGYDPYAITFSYGQRHKAEIESAKKVANSVGVKEHKIVEFDLGLFGGSSLTDTIKIPKHRSFEEMATGIPSTYVPARNLIFLSFAVAWAETLEACDIFIGVNQLDYSGYPDCRVEFLKAFEVAANLGTKEGNIGVHNIIINTPLIYMKKSEIIRLGNSIGVDYSLTTTCYDPSPSGVPCGECDACLLRLKGFSDNGLKDPIKYRRG